MGSNPIRSIITTDMPLTLQYVFLLVVAGALLIPGRIGRVGLVGLVPLGLSSAATAVRLGDGLSGLALRAAERGAPLGFLQINTGLCLLGIGLVVVAAATGTARAPARADAWLAILLIGAGAAPMVAAHLPLFPYIGWIPAVGAALGIGAAAVTLYGIGKLLRVGAGVVWVNRRLFTRTAQLPAASWAPLFMPLGVICVWHVAGSVRSPGPRRGRLVEMLLGLGFIGMLAGGTGVTGAFLLLAGIPLALWALPVFSTTWGRLLWLPLAWGAFMVLVGGLATEVTYTTLAAGGIAVAIWVYHTPE